MTTRVSPSPSERRSWDRSLRSASKDPALRKRGVTDAQADRLIRNTYKVLLTRGMVGTVVFAVDAQTQGFFDRLIG